VETSRNASLKAQATTIAFKPTPGVGGSQWEDNCGQSDGQEELLTAKDAKVMQSARRKLWFFFADLAVFLSELCG
jgi:hypothetical protein